MLAVKALTYLFNEIKQCTTYLKTVAQLTLWYSSDEKKWRIFTARHVITLYRAMSEDPNSSEVSVFRTFVARLMSLQKQQDQSVLPYRLLPP